MFGDKYEGGCINMMMIFHPTNGRTLPVHRRTDPRTNRTSADLRLDRPRKLSLAGLVPAGAKHDWPAINAVSPSLSGNSCCKGIQTERWRDVAWTCERSQSRGRACTDAFSVQRNNAAEGRRTTSCHGAGGCFTWRLGTWLQVSPGCAHGVSRKHRCFPGQGTRARHHAGERQRGILS